MGSQVSSYVDSTTSSGLSLLNELKLESVRTITQGFVDRLMGDSRFASLITNPNLLGALTPEQMEAGTMLVNLVINFTGPIEKVGVVDLFYAAKCFYYLQRESRRAPTAIVDEERLKLHSKEFDELRKHMRHSVAVYGGILPKLLGIQKVESVQHARSSELWKNESTVHHLTGIDDKDVLVKEWAGDLYHPGYYVALDHEAKEIIVAVRGTSNLRDAVTDLICENAIFAFRIPKTVLERSGVTSEEELRMRMVPQLKNMDGMIKATMSSDTGVPSSTSKASSRDPVKPQEKGSSSNSSSSSSSGEKSEASAGTINAKVGEDIINGSEQEEQGREKGARSIGKSKDKGERRGTGTKANMKERKRSILREWAQGKTSMFFRRASTSQTAKKQPLPEFIEFETETHAGFLKAAHRLDGLLGPVVAEALEEHPDYSVSLTGHSMGAAIATMLGLMWCDREAIGLKASNLHVFANAPAPALPYEDACHPAIQTIVSAVVLGDDIVSRVGLPHVEDIRQAVLRLSDPAFTWEEFAGENDDGSVTPVMHRVSGPATSPEEKEIYNKIYAVLKEEEMGREKLFPTGALWRVKLAGAHLTSAEAEALSKETMGERVDHHHFDEILLHSRMFSTHFLSLLSMSRLSGVDVAEFTQFVN